jgi:hypothetical protein
MNLSMTLAPVSGPAMRVAARKPLAASPAKNQKPVISQRDC